MYQTLEIQRFYDSQNKFHPSNSLRPLFQYYDYIFCNTGLQFNAFLKTEQLKDSLVNNKPSTSNKEDILKLHADLKNIIGEIIHTLHEKMHTEKQHTNQTSTTWVSLHNINSDEFNSYALILAFYLAEQKDDNYTMKYLPYLLSCYICNQQKILAQEYCDYFCSTVTSSEILTQRACTLLKLKKNRKKLFYRYFGVSGLSFSDIENHIKEYARSKTSNNLKGICRNIRNNYYHLLVFCVCSAVCRKYLDTKCDYTLSFSLFSNQLWASKSQNEPTAYPSNFFQIFLLFFTPAIIAKEYQPVEQPGFYRFYELFDTFISIKHPFSEDNPILFSYLSHFITFSHGFVSLNIGLLETLLQPNIYYDFTESTPQEKTPHSNAIFV